MKKIVSILLAILAAGILCGSLSGCTMHDGEVWLKNVDIVASLDDSGNLTVEERWVVHFDSPKKNAYKTFQLQDTSFGRVSELKDVSVYDADRKIYFDEVEIYQSPENYVAWTTDYDSFYLYKESYSNTELGLIVAPEEGTRTFVWNYTITDVAAAYADTSVIYWKIFNEAFQADIENFRLELSLPTATTQYALGWFHIEATDSYLELKPEKFVYTAKDIEAGTMVETRVVAPKTTFGELAKQSETPMLEKIRAEELAWAEAWNEKQRLYRTLMIVAIIVNIAIAALGIAAGVWIRIKNRPHREEYPEYARELPEGWTVAEAAHLFYYYDGGITQKDYRSRALSAVILDLTRRHYLEIAPIENNGKDRDEYRICFPEITEGMRLELLPHERAAYDLLKGARAEESGGVTMKEFKKYAKADYVEVNRLMKEFELESGRKFRKTRFAPGKARGKQAGALMLFVGIVLLFFNPIMLFFAPGLAVAGLALLLLYPKTMRLNQEGERQYRQLKGLEKYMLDFSNLKEYDIPKLILWEEYLVYATMMGISKEVVKNLKLAYPELQETDTYRGGMFYPARGYLFTYMWLSSRRGGLDFGTEMGKNIQQVATVARSLAMPKSSGGGFGGFGGGGRGFGGGGGGFGGGGGGFR